MEPMIVAYVLTITCTVFVSERIETLLIVLREINTMLRRTLRTREERPRLVFFEWSRNDFENARL